MAKINISIPEDFLQEMDRVRKERRMTRSGLLRRAFEAYLQKLQEEREEEEKRKGIEAAISLQDEIRKKSAGWDSIQALRKSRETRK